MTSKPARGFAAISPKRQREIASPADVPRTSGAPPTSSPPTKRARPDGRAALPSVRIANTWPRSDGRVASDAGKETRA